MTSYDSHGKELVRYVAELELGTAYGPMRGVRLFAATLDPVRLKPESTWSLATSLPLAQVSAAQVYDIYRSTTSTACAIGSSISISR